MNIQAYLKDFASKQLDTLGIKANNLNGKQVTIGVNTVYTETGPKPPGYVARNGVPAFFANGGLVNYLAAGGFPRFLAKGTDTVPAMLTPGEFVVNSRSTAENLPLLEAINAGRNFTPAKSWGSSDNGQPLQMTGTLTMDSGEVLGVFHGVATRAANQVMDSRSSGAARQRGGRG